MCDVTEFYPHIATRIEKHTFQHIQVTNHFKREAAVVVDLLEGQ